MRRIRVNYKSDLPPIEVKFKVNGVERMVPDGDFAIRFYIDGAPGTSFTCSHIDGVYSNCEKITATSLMCYIDNHKFGCGRLCCEYIDMSKNAKYEDGVLKTVTPSNLDVVLVDGVGDDNVEVINTTFGFEPNEIESIVAVETLDNDGINQITITETNGEQVTFGIKNGSKGDIGKHPCVGFFGSDTLLEAEYPHPEVGMWGYVGDSFPADIYRCNTEEGGWEDTGEDGGPGDDLAEYVSHAEERAHYDVGGYILPTAADNYAVGTKVYVRLSDGENTFSNFKTNDSGTYRALKINSVGESIVELLKVNVQDWVIMRRLVQMSDGKAVGDVSNVIGVYTGGIMGKEKIGIDNTSDAFTLAVKFRTPKSWPASTTYLVYNNTIRLALFATRHSLIFATSGNDNVIESDPLELDTDYKVIVTWDDGDISISVNGSVTSASDKSIAGGEGYFYVGSSQSSGSPSYIYPGVIESVKAYTSVVDDQDELECSYSTHDDLVLNLQPASVTEYCWLDLSGEMNVFAPRQQDAKISVVLETKEEEITPITAGLERKNLFGPECVTEETLLDETYGTVGSWTYAQRGQWAATAKTPAVENKYYCIINPYIGKAPARVGVTALNYLGNEVDLGNSTDHNIVLKGRKYIIAKAAYTSSQPTINNITFNLYRQLAKPDGTPLVEVYEMNSISEAISYINSRFGEDSELNSNINIDRQILSSPSVGTLTSSFADKTMLVLGDSLTAYNGWVPYVANRLKWKGIHNIAIGGANICGAYTPSSGEARNLIYQIKQSANLLGDVCYAEGSLINTAYVKRVDYVFVSMGYNDANNGYTAGSIDDVKGVAWNTLAPASDSATFPTIAAAIKYCMFYLKTTPIEGTVTVSGVSKNVVLDCTHAKIMWQTPVATSALFSNKTAAQTDARLKVVEDVITEVCEYYSIPVVNGRKLCGFTREEEDLYQNGKYLKDGTHPTDEGSRKIGEMNLGAILSNF